MPYKPDVSHVDKLFSKHFDNVVNSYYPDDRAKALGHLATEIRALFSEIAYTKLIEELTEELRNEDK